MFRASETSPLPGGSVRVGRDEACSNTRPRGMVITGPFGAPEQNPAYRPAGSFNLSFVVIGQTTKDCLETGFVNQQLTLSIHVRLT